MSVTLNAYRTTWGWIAIAATDEGLLGTTLPAESRELALAPLVRRWPDARVGETAWAAGISRRLARYFMGEDVSFCDIALVLGQSTDFQTRVWKVVRSIPRGQVRAYGWVAAEAGSPRSARAVGQAMAGNPFPLIVPCHRVIGKEGRLTGFGGGLEMKRRLLELEGVHTDCRRVLTSLV